MCPFQLVAQVLGEGSLRLVEFCTKGDSHLRGRDLCRFRVARCHSFPVKNFMTGRSKKGAEGYRNTCFIAAVVQLRDVIPEIEQTLKLSTWAGAILYHSYEVTHLSTANITWNVSATGSTMLPNYWGMFYGAQAFQNGD